PHGPVDIGRSDAPGPAVAVDLETPEDAFGCEVAKTESAAVARAEAAGIALERVSRDGRRCGDERRQVEGETEKGVDAPEGQMEGEVGLGARARNDAYHRAVKVEIIIESGVGIDVERRRRGATAAGREERQCIATGGNRSDPAHFDRGRSPGQA